MEFELPPELPPAEREALIAALERLLADERGLVGPPAGYRSPWRSAGLRENVDAEVEPGVTQPRGAAGAAARPGRSRAPRPT